MKGTVTVKARLVTQIEGSPSKDLLWLVTYDDDATLKDEELSEGSFGSILSGISDNESTTSPVPVPPAPTPPSAAAQAQTAAATAARKKNRKNGRFIKSGGQPVNKGRFITNNKADDDAIDKKSVSFSQDSAAASDSSVLSNGKRSSAREQRTARRSRLPPQADTSMAGIPSSQQPQLSSEAPQQPFINTSKKRPPANSGGGSKSSKKAKANGDDEVVKVQMLTGTLYLVRNSFVPHPSCYKQLVVFRRSHHTHPSLSIYLSIYLFVTVQGHQ